MNRFFVRRQCLLPTWRGWLLILFLFFCCLFAFFAGIHSFLAERAPLPGGIMVVEGWVPEYVLSKAAEEFGRNSYQKIYVTGGPVEEGELSSGFGSYANRGARILLKKGIPADKVVAVPSSGVVRDRTYASALALKSYLQAKGIASGNCHVISLGTHARRTRLLFAEGLGSGWRVGVTGVTDRSYEAARWWKYSAGVRKVIDETVAYLYAKLFFSP